MTQDPLRPQSSSTGSLPPNVPQRAAEPSLAFPPRRESIPPVQFGMRSLLVTISAAAIVLAIGSSIGGQATASIVFLMTALLSMVVVPVCFASLALYCAGIRRTFFLGAFVGAVLPHIGGLSIAWRGAVAGVSNSIFGIAIHFVAPIVAALLSGFVAVAARRYAERRGWNMPSDPPDLGRFGK